MRDGWKLSFSCVYYCGICSCCCRSVRGKSTKQNPVRCTTTTVLRKNHVGPNRRSLKIYRVCDKRLNSRYFIVPPAFLCICLHKMKCVWINGDWYYCFLFVQSAFLLFDIMLIIMFRVAALVAQQEKTSG